MNERDIKVCCIYLHGNAGSQLEGQIYLQELAEQNIALFTVDLSGSGKSQGKYITLGLQEQHDLTSVLKFLDEIFQFEEYVIWGRSMGAVTALLHETNYSLHPRLSQKVGLLL